MGDTAKVSFDGKSVELPILKGTDGPAEQLGGPAARTGRAAAGSGRTGAETPEPAPRTG